MSKNSDGYTPIDCALHSEYELAIMHRSQIQLAWTDRNGLQHIETVRPVDMITRDKQEFLQFRTINNELHEIRLDMIIQSSINNINR